MTHPTEVGHRQAVIDGLRQLADLLEQNPGLSVNRTHTIAYSASGLFTGDAEARAEVDRVAELLGEAPAITLGDHYQVQKTFGGVEYKATAISRRRMREFDAERTYRGSVQPEAVTR